MFSRYVHRCVCVCVSAHMDMQVEVDMDGQVCRHVYKHVFVCFTVLK